MKKLFTILTVVAISTTSSFGQISDRENDESTYLIGARPIAGNFGFFFGISTSDISELIDSNWSEAGIPLINVKYYYTDQLVLKGGVQIKKKRRSIEGEFDATSDLDALSDYKHVETDAEWSFGLGVEKHFSLSNIFDAYIGLNGNLGYERSVRTHNESYFNGDYNDNEGSSFGITYGMEGIVGTNFFIADLPLALGCEVGFVAKNYGPNKYKYEYDVSTDGTASSGTYYTSLVDDFEDASANSFSGFSELKARRFDILPIARVTFTYYFKN